jgi:hypothetical protein
MWGLKMSQIGTAKQREGKLARRTVEIVIPSAGDLLCPNWEASWARWHMPIVLMTWEGGRRVSELRSWRPV